MESTFCRVFYFNSAHRLHNDSWSEEKNRSVFGKCNNEHYHGHNYKLIVKVRGVTDPETGYVIDAKVLNELVEREIIERYDHRNLNLDTLEFKGLNPTVENIAGVICQRLSGKVGANKQLTIVLYETERNYVEYAGS